MTSRRDAPLDVAVIGGGQAGVAVGYQLRQHGLRFVILDAGPDVGHVWRSRWDSLALFTPTQYSGLPGMDFPGEKDRYPSRDEVADYLESYASAFDLPITVNARVTSLAENGEGFKITTEGATLAARQVV